MATATVTAGELGDPRLSIIFHGGRTFATAAATAGERRGAVYRPLTLVRSAGGNATCEAVSRASGRSRPHEAVSRIIVAGCAWRWPASRPRRPRPSPYSSQWGGPATNHRCRHVDSRAHQRTAHGRVPRRRRCRLCARWGLVRVQRHALVAAPAGRLDPDRAHARRPPAPGNRRMCPTLTPRARSAGWRDHRRCRARRRDLAADGLSQPLPRCGRCRSGSVARGATRRSDLLAGARIASSARDALRRPARRRRP